MEANEGLPPFIDPKKSQLLEAYDAGAFVLESEAPKIRGAVDLLSVVSHQPADEALLPAAAEVATDMDNPGTNAIEILPLIQKAVEPFTPKQTDPSRAATERWTQDWRAVAGELKSRTGESPELRDRITEWFLGPGSDMVETTYAPHDSKKPLYAVVGGANEQCVFRPILAMVSMATAEFREEHGLVTQPEHSLNGEDGREPGWLRDGEFLEELRAHVADRIEGGEISPNILVGGSAATGRVLKEAELEKVSKYFADGTEPLYEERGWTEADAMLAGALHAFGGDPETMTQQELPVAEGDDIPGRLISFDSPIGNISVTVTSGKEANLLSQLQKTHEHKPEIFDGVDGLYGTTTAIYTWVQRPILMEAAAKLGLRNFPVAMLGVSAHAAGIQRKPEVLIGELTNYLRANYGVAERMLETSENNAQLDIRLLGGAGLYGASV